MIRLIDRYREWERIAVGILSARPINNPMCDFFSKTLFVVKPLKTRACTFIEAIYLRNEETISRILSANCFLTPIKIHKRYAKLNDTNNVL